MCYTVCPVNSIPYNWRYHLLKGMRREKYFMSRLQSSTPFTTSSNQSPTPPFYCPLLHFTPGMALQGFKSCAGKPPGSHSAILTVLAEKLPGYSRKKGGVVGANGKLNNPVVVADSGMFVASGDAQVTFRR